MDRSMPVMNTSTGLIVVEELSFVDDVLLGGVLQLAKTKKTVDRLDLLAKFVLVGQPKFTVRCLKRVKFQQSLTPRKKCNAS
jgi:hypothetical protein